MKVSEARQFMLYNNNTSELFELKIEIPVQLLKAEEAET
jgi:hypothetical protein